MSDAPRLSTPCPAYTEQRLAAVYDVLNPIEASDLYFRGLAGTPPLEILDIGCGTGRLACHFAARGHRVTGVDPASGMLVIARSKPGGGTVTWIEGDATSLPADRKFDLIVMTGNVFQVFLGDAEIRATLAAAQRLLKADGRLVFGTRNPAARDWESWTPHETAVTVSAPAVGKVDVHYDVTRVDGRFVSYETHFRFEDGEKVVASSVLRFSDHDEVLSFVREAGLIVRAVHGDWDGSAFSPASPDIIVTAGLA